MFPIILRMWRNRSPSEYFPMLWSLRQGYQVDQIFTWFLERNIRSPKCSPFLWQGHLLGHIFTCLKELSTEQPWSGAALPTPPDMTMVGSARVQNRTTSAPKLDPPPSPMTMGCWHAITIKAGTPLHHNHHSGYTPHHLFSPSTSPKKILFSPLPFPIVPWCPAFSALCGV